MTNKEQFLQGKQAFNEGKYQEARRVLSRVTSDDEILYAQAQLMLAETQLELRNERGALKYLKQIPDIDDEVIQSRKHFLYGQTAMKTGMVDDIEAHFSKVTKVNESDYFHAQLVLGEFALMRSEFEEARGNLEEVTEEYPETYARAQYILGATYDGVGDYQEAKKYLKRVTKEMSAEVYNEAQSLLGYICADAGDELEAAKYFSAIDFSTAGKELLEDKERIHFFIANTEIQSGNPAKALELLSTITRKQNPAIYAEAQVSMAGVYFELGEEEKGIESLHRVKKNDNKEAYAVAQLDIGSSFLRNDNPEEALKIWRKIKEEDSQEFYEKAQGYIALVKYEQSVEAGEENPTLDLPEDIMLNLATNNLANLIQDAEDGDNSGLQQWMETIVGDVLEENNLLTEESLASLQTILDEDDIDVDLSEFLKK